MPTPDPIARRLAAASADDAAYAKMWLGQLHSILTRDLATFAARMDVDCPAMKGFGPEFERIVSDAAADVAFYGAIAENRIAELNAEDPGTIIVLRGRNPDLGHDEEEAA